MVSLVEVNYRKRKIDVKGLGERIRWLRKKRGLTLIEISKATAIDPATISRIENGKMPGTLDSHVRIAEALGVRLPELYENVLLEHEEAKRGETKERVETFYHSSGVVAELLTTAALQKKMMPILLKIKPGGYTENEEFPLSTERFIYILKGSVTMERGEDIRKLREGESLYFVASRPHHFKNPSKSEEAQCLSVITPMSL